MAAGHQRGRDYPVCQTESPFARPGGDSIGTALWGLRTSTGTLLSGFTLDAVQGIMTFTSDQAGSAYYLTARSYDIYSAAADMWLQKQARLSNWYQFEGDGQKFMRQQAFEQAGKMEKMMRGRSGANRGQGSVRSGTFRRVDINERS